MQRRDVLAGEDVVVARLELDLAQPEDEAGLDAREVLVERERLDDEVVGAEVTRRDGRVLDLIPPNELLEIYPPLLTMKSGQRDARGCSRASGLYEFDVILGELEFMFTRSLALVAHDVDILPVRMPCIEARQSVR